MVRAYPVKPDGAGFNPPVLHTVKNEGDLPLRGIVIALDDRAAQLCAVEGVQRRLVTVIGDYPVFILPAPEEVLERGVRAVASGVLWEHTGATPGRVVRGLGLQLRQHLLQVHAGRGPVEGIPFQQFLAPGILMMVVIQNAFANTSSSIMISKVQGNIVDTLMPPLSPGEILTGPVCLFALDEATRLVGAERHARVIVHR